MKPIKTDGTNVRLVLPEEEHLPEEQRRGDLPIERCFFVDPETQDQKAGFESTWQPDEGERRAIANGAPIMLRLWGANHPPVKLEVGDPPEEGGEALVSVEKALRASSRFFDELSKRMAAEEEISPEEIPAMFREQLRKVMDEGKPKPGGSTNGTGPGH